MILADTSVWIDHYRSPVPDLQLLLNTENVLMHPFVLGELMMGSLKDRRGTHKLLTSLETVTLAGNQEVFDFVERKPLFGRGLGFIDAHLLAAVVLTPGTKLWTRELRLNAAAADLGVAYERPN